MAIRYTRCGSLPISPLQYDPQFFNKFSSILGLFFNGLNSTISQLVAPKVVSGTTSVTTSTHKLNDQDYYIGVNYAGAATVLLTNAKGIENGRELIVKDESGLASANNITISANNITISATIDGAASYVINTNYGKVNLIYNNGWFTI